MASRLAQRIQNLYDAQARAIVAHDLRAVKALHASEFTAIPLDGKKRDEAEWERDCLADMKTVQYKTTTYEVTKLSEDTRKNVVAYVTRRCSGTLKQDKKHFNTEVLLRDTLIKDSKGWKIQTSETISRELRLSGNKISIREMPRAYAMMQGCGDTHEGGGGGS